MRTLILVLEFYIANVLETFETTEIKDESEEVFFVLNSQFVQKFLELHELIKLNTSISFLTTKFQIKDEIWR